LRSRPQSDNSDFGWARAREAIPQSRYYPAARRTKLRLWETIAGFVLLFPACSLQ
jgi:hypothetical protein